MTFFDSLKHSYANVTIINEKEIETISFLEATESMTTLFDLLGSSAFGVVRNDLLGNVKKIRQKYDENPSAYNTLQRLALSEKNEKKKTAAEALLWLKR